MFANLNVESPITISDDDSVIVIEEVNPVVNIAPLINFINHGVPFLLPLNQYMVIHQEPVIAGDGVIGNINVNQELTDNGAPDQAGIQQELVLDEGDNFNNQEIALEEAIEHDINDDGVPDQAGFQQEFVLEEENNFNNQEIALEEAIEHDINNENIIAEEPMIVDNENENEAEDSGYGSENEGSDSDPDYLPDADEEEEVEEVDIMRQYYYERKQKSRQRHVLGVMKKYWRTRVRKLRLERDNFIRRAERRLRRLKNRRQQTERIIPRRQRRPDPTVEKPKRNWDVCWGCAKSFYKQGIRLWSRCDDCGLWLCPDCGEEPVHCQNYNIL